MKPFGCSILFVNPRGRILLVLRDNYDFIPFPGMWDLPGGNVEPGETPAECIRREMNEELGLDIGCPVPYRVFEFDDRIEHVFVKEVEISVDSIELTEGQRIAWFSRDDLREMTLAFGFNRVVDAFFTEKDHRL